MAEDRIPPFATPRTTSRSLQFIRRYRRSIAFFLASIGVIVGVSAVTERPAVSPVVVFRADLPPGHVITDNDLAVVDMPTDISPPRTVSSPDEALGKITAGSVGRHELVTDQRFVGTHLLVDDPPDTVAYPLAIDDLGALPFLKIGNTVDILAARSSSALDSAPAADAEVVAQSARIIALPNVEEVEIDILSDPGTQANRGTLLVAVPTSVAATIAGLAPSTKLSVVVRS